MGGGEGIVEMINFSPKQFESLWSDLEELFMRTHNVGRGQRTKVTFKDALLIMLTVMKHGGLWQVQAKLFAMKAPKMGLLVANFLFNISEYFHQYLVMNTEAFLPLNGDIRVSSCLKTF